MYGTSVTRRIVFCDVGDIVLLWHAELCFVMLDVWYFCDLQNCIRFNISKRIYLQCTDPWMSNCRIVFCDVGYMVLSVACRIVFCDVGCMVLLWLAELCFVMLDVWYLLWLAELCFMMLDVCASVICRIVKQFKTKQDNSVLFSRTDCCPTVCFHDSVNCPACSSDTTC